VAFAEIESDLSLATDISGNSYVVLDPGLEDLKLSYEAGIRSKLTTYSDTDDLVSSGVPSLDLPANFMGKEVNISLLNEVQQLVTSQLIPDQEVKVGDLSNLNEALDLRANPFTYAYLLSAYLNKLEVKNEIRYGYLIFPELQGVDTSRPFVWVVTVSNGQILVYDPFLYDMFGYQTSSSSSINKLMMGMEIWYISLIAL
jgi:hypothetical protein